MLSPSECSLFYGEFSVRIANLSLTTRYWTFCVCDVTTISVERYETAIELFLSVYPSGEVRKQSCRLEGHEAVKRPRLQKPATKSFCTAIDEAVQLTDHEDGMVVQCVIPLDEISEDEWSDTSEDDDAT